MAHKGRKIKANKETKWKTGKEWDERIICDIFAEGNFILSCIRYFLLCPYVHIYEGEI